MPGPTGQRQIPLIISAKPELQPQITVSTDLQELSWPTFGFIELYQPYPYYYRPLSVHNSMVCFRVFHTLPAPEESGEG